MGVDSTTSTVPPLPAPTETTESIVLPSDLQSDLVSDASRAHEEKSAYSIPNDGTPVTLKTRSYHHHVRSQTSLLIEYFEASKPVVSGSTASRQPDIRVRLIPSKRGKKEHIQATDSKSTGSRKISISRRRAAAGAASPTITATSTRLYAEPPDVDDARSMNSVASATEESAVSRNNPVDAEIDRNDRGRRATSPLIPQTESNASFLVANTSEISDIPADSFLDDAYGQRSDILDPLVPAALTVGPSAANNMADDRIHGAKVRGESRDRRRESTDKHRSGKSQSRTRKSSGEVRSESQSHHRRRSSRGHHESVVSAADSTRSYDQHSTISAASKSSINNPKLLETVEDAIRRLILPELSALKREQSKRESRRGSITSTTSASREDLVPDRRKQSEKKAESAKEGAKKKIRDRDAARHAYGDSSPLGFNQDSLSESVIEDADTPGQNNGRLKATAAGAAVGVASAALADKISDDRRQRRRRRAEHGRSRSLGGGGGSSVADDYPEDHDFLSPPMPLMSEINPSEVTRTSLLSVDSDRPMSATEEQGAAYVTSQDAASAASTPTQARSLVALPQSFGTKHANISHGDLTTLARRRTGEYEGAAARMAAAQTAGHHPDDYLDDEHLDEYDDAEYDDDYQYPPTYAYQQHVLSPIPSEAEDRSDAGDSWRQHSRAGAHSPTKSHRSQTSPASSHVLGIGFDDPHTKESEVGPRSTYVEESEVSHRPVNKIVSNPNLVNVPIGIESAVASLIDGSVMTDSQVAYPREEPLYEEHEGQSRGATPSGLSVDSQGSRPERQGFQEEYEPDEYGHKRRYQPSPLQSATRHSPTDSEAAITAGAVAALRAKRAQAEGEEAAGVHREFSFKRRAEEIIEPIRTPTHNMERFDKDDRPRMGASGIPDWNDPMPEAEYIRHSVAASLDDWQQGRITPTQRQFDGTKTTALTTAAVMAVTSAQPQDDDDWHRTSEERKRDTLVTNPYEDTSPLANPVLNENLGAFANYGPGFNTGSPIQQKGLDEGYMSQGPNRTPEARRQNGQGEEDPFAASDNGAFLRQLGSTGMSQGMQTPIYDGATGMGIDSIESRDIVALMQFLMARDAKKDANEGALVQALIQTAVEMQNSFSEVKRLIAQTRDEINDNTDRTVYKAINGPRPYPGAVRSAQGSSQGTQEELNFKKQSIFRRALKGLSSKGTNDLAKIEDMLNQLLSEVDVLKHQTAPAGTSSLPPQSAGHQSFENVQPEMQSEDHGYEPDGLGTSTNASQSGHLSAQSHGGSKQGFERKFSDHRISTVPESIEEDHTRHSSPRNQARPALAPTDAVPRRGSSAPLESPMEPPVSMQQQGSMSNENTPKGERNKKTKGGGGWLPKISRWSETTTSSVQRVFRSRANSKRDTKDQDWTQHPPSRSVSSLGEYDDDYDDDDISANVDVYGDGRPHSAFSTTDRVKHHHSNGAPNGTPMLQQPPTPKTHMTPEDPKYKAHRNSLNLQHPQPRQGQTERFRNALEFSAEDFMQDFMPSSPRSADWGNSVTSLHRLPPNQNQARYNEGQDEPNWRMATPGNTGPPRPPKEPIEESTPQRTRVSRMKEYTSSPRPENRNLSGAMGGPARRPSGPRAMTPKNAGDEDAHSPRDERRRKRGKF